MHHGIISRRRTGWPSPQRSRWRVGLMPGDGRGPVARAPATRCPRVPIDRAGRRGRGRAQRHRPGPATSRTAATSPDLDWVSGFEEATGLPGQRQARQHVRRDVHAHADRQLRRACRHPATRRNRLISAGRRAAHQPNLIPNYADVFEGPQGQAPQHRGRRALRRAPRPRRQPASCTTRRS